MSNSSLLSTFLIILDIHKDEDFILSGCLIFLCICYINSLTSSGFNLGCIFLYGSIVSLVVFICFNSIDDSLLTLTPSYYLTRSESYSISVSNYSNLALINCSVCITSNLLLNVDILSPSSIIYCIQVFS